MIRTLLHRLSAWLTTPRVAEVVLPLHTRAQTPTPSDLLAELRDTAWTCASINAATCASYAPRLYVRTRPGQPPPRVATRAAPHHATSAERIEEVTAHPLLDLLRQVNPVHNQFDLFELTTLDQEVIGVAYWLLEFGPLGIPVAVWPLPAHRVTPTPEGYLYRAASGGGDRQRLLPAERVIAFRYPDPRDPYNGGLSPLRACYDQVRLVREWSQFKRERLENHAIPDAIVSPEGVLADDERARLETQWNHRMRRAGAGRVLIADTALRVQLLQHSMGDLAALADLRTTREQICNAFHVPLAYLSTETNLANLQAAEQQHLARAIVPRLRRRDEKLNEQLIPLYDPTGRLFLASDDPTPNNRELTLREREMLLKYGVLSADEMRATLGLPPRPAPASPTPEPNA
jgi:HK97 family phage portal protein